MKFIRKVVTALVFVALGYLICYYDWLTVAVDYIEKLIQR